MTISSGAPIHHFRRFCFRFFFLYSAFYCSHLVLLVIPVVSKNLDSWWLHPVQWVAGYLLGSDYKIDWMPYESRDTTFNYIQVFILACLSFVVAIIWSSIDRKDRHDLQGWLHLFLKYYVGLTMIVYGLKMVVHVLYPHPENIQLLYSFSETTRYGVMANFLGTSPLLQSFLGVVEVVGGTLILFRRTMLLGALITGVILINVVILTFTQDVPLKLTAIHLFVFNLLLIAPHVHALIGFFILHKPSLLVSHVPVYSQRQKMLFRILKFSFIAWFLFIHSVFILDDYRKKGDGQPRHHLSGLHDVDIFVLDNDTLPPLLGDYRIWKRVEMYGKHYAVIYTIDDHWHRYYYEDDSVKNILSFSEYKQHPFATFNYTEDEHFIYLKGHIRSDTAVVDLRKNVERDFPVNKSGFHWVQDFVIRQ
jgi:hypothetical protein